MKAQLETFLEHIRDTAILSLIKWGALVVGVIFLYRGCSNIQATPQEDPISRVEKLGVPRTVTAVKAYTPNPQLAGAVAILREELGITDTCDAVAIKLDIIAEHLLTEGARNQKYNVTVRKQMNPDQYWTDESYRRDIVNAIITPIK